MEQLFITASDGYPLSALYAGPVGKCAGTIVISSATGVKKEFYINFARYLISKGYIVFLFDYRGIGGSVHGPLRDIPYHMHEWGTLDMTAVIDYLVEEKKLTNITWIGHSVGAQLIGFADHREHIKKIIAINAAVGYWKNFPFPMNACIWLLWFALAPMVLKLYGYCKTKSVGWGEDLPPNMARQWRKWCLSKTYFSSTLQEQLGTPTFSQVDTPITAIFMSDDFIANDKTVPLMMNFFPNAPYEIWKLPVNHYTREKVGHIGIFRKRFSDSLWPLLLKLIERQQEVLVLPNEKKFTVLSAN